MLRMWAEAKWEMEGKGGYTSRESIGTYNGRGEGRRCGYITGSVDVETCVITKTHFRMLDPLLVNSRFNRSTFHVK